MTKTFSGQSCAIRYEDDNMLGNVTICMTDSNQRRSTMDVSGEDLYRYAIEYIRKKKIQHLEFCPDNELLGLPNK